LEVNQKPAVLLFVLGPVPESLVLALEHGLEEEGIPGEREQKPAGDTVKAASQAARASRINVGLAIGAEAGGIVTGAVLHQRDLPEDRPLFCLAQQEIYQNRESLYRLGRNAARLVKGNPFILGASTD
jgi:hypothetical protein